MNIMLFFITTICCMLCLSPWRTFQSSSYKTINYIVLVDEPSSGVQITSLHPEELDSYYNSFLSPLTTTPTSLNQDPRIIHSYRHALTGFAAMLSEDESKELEKMEGVISVRPERILSLHTTHSPSFLGLNQNNNNGLWRDSKYGKGVIIGLLDTGITPDHPSFSDRGMPPPPAKWKGKSSCQLMTTNCNKKIIGARSFVTKHNKTAVDDNGHGTHTSSTAAGSFVAGANVLGNAQGTASGIAPRAHLAIYKVCTPSGGCPDSAMIAGMDAAIQDGVDVISISIGGDVLDHFYDDIMSISSFRAMEKGIFVTFSAGNRGPHRSSVCNGAPWALTVGASTIDREIRATVVLQGNNRELIHGQTAFQPKGFVKGEYLPLVYVSNCSNALSLSMAHINGKMVVCEYAGGRIQEGEAVKKGGGAAMILVNFEAWANTTLADAHVLPAAHVGYADGLKIKAYINSTARPKAKILFRGTLIGGDDDIRAPVVAAFSSRGPNLMSSGILKPDVLGPGVNILAAWPTSAEEENINHTNNTFTMQSGTSMSCPHLSGVAALLKSAHPDWSPAAIKSALMTTTDVVDRTHGPILDATFLPADVFATGAGHVNPQAASDPGLIYDIKPKDYIPYLCGLNYTDQQLRLFSNNMSCSKVKSIPEAQLNYPSFSLTFTGRATNPQTYTRTVTNVGEPHSSYNVTLVSPPGIEVRVAPMKLNFSKLNQQMNYNVTFSRKPSSAPNGTTVKGFLKLCSVKQCVSSPIAVILLL